MKRLIVFGLAFATMATVALAQQAPAPPPAQQAAPAPTQDHASPPPQPDHRDAMDHPDEMWPRDHLGEPPKDASRQDMGMRRHHWQMSPASKAAHFRIEEGDKKIDIKCADDEPTKACAEVLLQLIDKLATPSDLSDDERG
ncbi:hypothetical protein [Rhizobium tubonense]|uniref:Uncharacterized protein n=1 Tax=Rhizobium tubonense TaxID=484088 RepID=A0A2W4CTL3_9HYPH|nr:hypothetical protein [Rhizobium tubonense]PZM15732.1 hypothetical protein CPY51_06080 [Rhizobium tubonense]